MKLVCAVLVLLAGQTSAWFFRRNLETTATSDGAVVDDRCLQYGEEGSCEFFDCFEQRLPCGRNFYMQRFGNHYCNRFERYMESFTEAGQQFIVNSQRCVTQYLLEHYQREYVNCHELEHDAIALIGPCYLQHGFCDVINDNSEQFMEVFEFNDLFGSGSGKLWRELLVLAKECGGRALNNFMRVTATRFTNLRSIFGGDDE